MFCIVEFIDDDSMAIVPTIWLTENGKCLWPPVRHVTAADNLARKASAPNKTWKAYAIRVLFTTGMNYATQILTLLQIVSALSYCLTSLFNIATAKSSCLQYMCNCCQIHCNIVIHLYALSYLCRVTH